MTGSLTVWTGATKLGVVCDCILIQGLVIYYGKGATILENRGKLFAPPFRTGQNVLCHPFKG